MPEEPSQGGHWQDLASELGADPAPVEPDLTGEPDAQITEPTEAVQDDAPATYMPVSSTTDDAASSDWTSLAGELGIESPAVTEIPAETSQPTAETDSSIVESVEVEIVEVVEQVVVESVTEAQEPEVESTQDETQAAPDFFEALQREQQRAAAVQGDEWSFDNPPPAGVAEYQPPPSRPSWDQSDDDASENEEGRWLSEAEDAIDDAVETEASEEASATDESSDDAKESGQRTGRRRRRRRGRRGGSADKRSSSNGDDVEDSDAAVADGASDEDVGEEPADTGESPRSKHRNVTSWSEAIGMLVDGNLEARAKSGNGGGRSRGRGRGGRRRGGRGSKSKS